MPMQRCAAAVLRPARGRRLRTAAGAVAMEVVCCMAAVVRRNGGLVAAWQNAEQWHFQSDESEQNRYPSIRPSDFSGVIGPPAFPSRSSLAAVRPPVEVPRARCAAKPPACSSDLVAVLGQRFCRQWRDRPCIAAPARSMRERCVANVPRNQPVNRCFAVPPRSAPRACHLLRFLSARRCLAHELKAASIAPTHYCAGVPHS